MYRCLRKFVCSREKKKCLSRSNAANCKSRYLYVRSISREKSNSPDQVSMRNDGRRYSAFYSLNCNRDIWKLCPIINQDQTRSKVRSSPYVFYCFWIPQLPWDIASEQYPANISRRRVLSLSQSSRGRINNKSRRWDITMRATVQQIPLYITSTYDVLANREPGSRSPDQQIFFSLFFLQRQFSTWTFQLTRGTTEDSIIARHMSQSQTRFASCSLYWPWVYFIIYIALFSQ